MLTRFIQNILTIIIDFVNWPLVFINYFNLKRAVVLKHKSGLSFYARSRAHSKIVQEMFRGIVYDTSQIQRVAKNTKDGIIIDIGAHVGSFAFWFDFLYPDNTFYLYEPDRNNHDILAHNIELNKKTNFKLRNECVSAKNGLVDFYSSSGNGLTQSSSIIQRKNATEKYTVQSRTLTDILANIGDREVSLLKIDCEGAEFEIILQSPSSIWSKIHFLLLEYHDDLANKPHTELTNYLSKYYDTIEIAPSSRNHQRGIIFAGEKKQHVP